MPSVKEVLATMEYGPAPEAETIVADWLAAHRDGFGHYIGGAIVPSEGGGRFETRNPARDEPLAEVAGGTAADIDRAVAAASSAFPAWSARSGHERARYLYAIARHIQKRERFLAVLEALDNGKPIRESRDIDVPLAARHFYHHAGWAELLESEFPGERAIGVCGQIIPWNFPLLMLAWKIAPALAAGNTVVLKPAEYTPLTALAFAEICREIGLPPGVVNIVTGDGATGAALVAHPGLGKVAFTGSTEVGRSIRETLAGTGRKLSLELGGKSPFIVFEDADLDAAVEGVVDGIFFNQGQVCCAGSRLLVQEGIAERFHERLKRRMARLRLGDPLDKSTDIGAIVAPVQAARIARLVAQGEAEGAVKWQAPCALPARGCWFAPTLFTEVAPASTIADIEIFGPVLASMSFRTPGEAASLADNTRYGLAASVWSETASLAIEVAAQIKAGVVWINSTNLFDAGAAFGGYRESGFGREGGREGMAEYLTPKDAVASRHPLVPASVPASLAPGPLTDRPAAADSLPAIDRTAKLYIGGKQVRPDAGYSYRAALEGGAVSLAGYGNRKDIRNAVEAAAKAGAWSRLMAHSRAQVLYYLAENLAARTQDFVERLAEGGRIPLEAARREVETAIARIFWYAAATDKFDGRLHPTRSRHMTLAVPEPFGTIGIVCPDEAPLLGFLSLVLPAIAMGNRVVAVPSASAPLAATDLYQVLDTSDMPAGVVNIVTGPADPLARILAEHDDVEALWYVGSAEGAAAVERASAGNLKVTWTEAAGARDWLSASEGHGRRFLTRATQIKTIWLPYGE